MTAIWTLGEIAEGRPTRLTLELATLASHLAGECGGEARTILVSEGASTAGPELAACGPDVLAVGLAAGTDAHAGAVAVRLATLLEEGDPDVLLIGATPEGRDIAGALVGLTDRSILVSATCVAWTEAGPEAEVSSFGGRLVTRSVFADGRGIVLVRPGSVAARPAEAAGRVETASVEPVRPLPGVRLVEHVVQEETSASIEEARAIVGVGRGVGGPDGVALVGRLAEALGGVVGGTRAAVDSGWLAYASQIGQTGKVVKPDLYLACGVSGAIQHKVGVQTAGTIVSINRDPDAPITEFADLVVVGDLFEIVPRLTEAIREHRQAT